MCRCAPEEMEEQSERVEDVDRAIALPVKERPISGVTHRATRKGLPGTEKEARKKRDRVTSANHAILISVARKLSSRNRARTVVEDRDDLIQRDLFVDTDSAARPRDFDLNYRRRVTQTKMAFGGLLPEKTRAAPTSRIAEPRSVSTVMTAPIAKRFAPAMRGRTTK